MGTGTEWYKQEETPATFSQELVDQLKRVLTLKGIIHIDTAECYRTYPELSCALAESNKPRDEIFITDKYSTQFKITESPSVGLKESLRKNNLAYVDLYLLHSPFIKKEINGFTLKDAWLEMEQIYFMGLAKNIGVSNFSQEDIKKILSFCKVKPQVNQIEFNCFLQNQTPGIVKFCQHNDILLEAYSPLSPLQRRTDMDHNSTEFYSFLAKLTDKYSKTEAQILLRWVHKRGILPVTTSSKIERIQKAQEIFEFDLTDEEMSTLTQLGLRQKAQRLYWRSEYNKYNEQSQIN